MEQKYWCKKCAVLIGGHNRYLHEGMCDNCFFNAYFPEKPDKKRSLARFLKQPKKENKP